MRRLLGVIQSLTFATFEHSFYTEYVDHNPQAKEKFRMPASNKTLRTCANGHQYYKRSDCPTCPVCEQERKPENGFLSLLSAPARRALEHHGITSLQKLSAYSEKEIMKFHGMGPASLPILRTALEENGLSFKS